jgi:hypothetical protein
MYPCNDNQLLNFVCIHPDAESQANPGDGKYILMRKALYDLTDQE